MRFDPKFDFIVTAWAERASGPGWSNRLIKVLVQDRRDCSHRIETIQSDEMTPEIDVLFNVSQVTAVEMTRHVESAVARPRRKIA